MLDITCESSALADDSHVMSSIISSENYAEHALKCHLPVVIGAFRVNIH